MVLVASVGTGRVCFLSGPSTPTTMAVSGRLGRALVMRQPTYAFERISCPMCSRSSHLESGALFPLSLFLAVIVPAVWVLLRNTEHVFFLVMSISVGAMLGLTVDTRSASVLWRLWMNFTHFLRCGRTRILKCSFPTRFDWRSVPSRRFGLQSCSSAARTWKLGSPFHELHVAAKRDQGQHFLEHLCRSQVPGVVQPVSQTPGWPAHMPIRS